MFLSTCTLDVHTDCMYKLAMLWVTYSVVTSVISYSFLGSVHVNVTLIRIEPTREEVRVIDFEVIEIRL